MALAALQGTSCVSPNYMTQQFDINERMRAILIDWLIEVNQMSSLNKCYNDPYGFCFVFMQF